MPRFLLPAAIGRPAFRVSPMSGFSIARQKMVDGQVRTSDVTDPRIIDAMLAVPREAFVPPKQQPLAYLDLDLAVSDGGTAKRFLIKPAVTAKLLQAAQIGDTDKVLVVGCATGYVSRILEQRGCRVVGIERNPEAAAQARQGGIEVIEADLDGIDYDGQISSTWNVLNGTTEVAPSGLYRQLKEGGRLVGVFALSMPARATIVTRSHGDFGNRALFDATAPVLPGLERLPAFVF